MSGMAAIRDIVRRLGNAVMQASAQRPVEGRGILGACPGNGYVLSFAAVFQPGA